MIARAHELGLKVIVDMVPNHSSDEHAWFQAALAAGPGSAGARALHVPRGPGRARRAAAEQLGVRLRRRRVDPRHRGRRHARPVVPAPLRHQAARLQLGAPRGARRVRVDPALLARPGRRRLPRRRRARPDQGAGPARHRDERTTMLGTPSTSAEQPRIAAERRASTTRAQPDVGPGRRPRGLPRVAQDPRVLRHARPHPLRRGLGRAAGARRGLRPPRRDAPGVQLRLPHAPWDAEDLRAVITSSLHAADSVGAPSTWVLSNHDVVRHASRLGYARARRG